MYVCVFAVVVIVMFFNSVFLFFCLFVYLFVFAVVICLFFRDISLNTSVIEVVRFKGLSMILVNLWKT